MSERGLAVLMGRERGGFTRDFRFAEMAPAPAPDPLAEAYAAGFAAGEAQALAQAAAAIATERETRARLASGLARIDAAAAEMLAQRLTDTVAALCEATLVPLALDREALIARARRAAALFARADDACVIHAHPDDVPVLREELSESHFRGDPALPRGALRVETTQGGAEDGPEQWRRAIAEALGLC